MALLKCESPCKEISVQTKPLDEFNFKDVGLIKIDVEGAEDAVLDGAINTIKNNMPVIIIELEDRHSIGTLQRNIKKLGDIGYQSYFIFNNTT